MKLRKHWRATGEDRWERTDGAVVQSGGDVPLRWRRVPTWVWKDKNGDLRKKINGHTKKVVRYFSPEAAMKAADRDSPR